MPKQLLPIVGARTMLQETVARLAGVAPKRRTWVVTGRLHAPAVRRQLPGLPRSHVLVEPEARNTAPAIALAALHIVRHDPEAVMAVLPADHVITDLRGFQTQLSTALDVAERTGALVTLGIKPTRPETGYGYIRTGAALRGSRGQVAWVKAFIEKPTRARAQALLTRGGVLWNAGIFAWRAADILAALRLHLPAVITPLVASFGKGQRTLAATYRRLPSVSIDTGVLERADRVAVVRATFGWSDVGSWAAIEPLWRNKNGGGQNAVRGHALALDSRGCVVDASGRLIALLGVEDLVVVETADAVLVCHKDRAQDVRLLTAELGRRGMRQYL